MNTDMADDNTNGRRCIGKWRKGSFSGIGKKFSKGKKKMCEYYWDMCLSAGQRTGGQIKKNCKDNTIKYLWNDNADKSYRRCVVSINIVDCIRLQQ